MDYENLYELIRRLTEAPCIDGYEARGASIAVQIAQNAAVGFFDAYEILSDNSVLLMHHTGKENAKRLVLDAHLDTVGMIVTELCENGFVKVAPCGGLDPYVLPSTPVVLYGVRDVYGVVTSVPPHLQRGSEKKKLTVGDLYVDTGLSDEEQKSVLAVGTPVGYYNGVMKLANDRVVSKYLDDKACAAAILYACDMLNREGYDGSTDVYVLFSAGEEKSALGARTFPYRLKADACIVLDVNFAHAPGVKDYESLALGKGGGVSYSATIKRELTQFIVSTANKYGIPVQKVVEMRSTGTNATQLMRNGLPCAVLSVPLRNMHTDAECASLSDIAACGELLAACVKDFPAAGGQTNVD